MTIEHNYINYFNLFVTPFANYFMRDKRSIKKNKNSVHVKFWNIRILWFTIFPPFEKLISGFQINVYIAYQVYKHPSNEFISAIFQPVSI